MEKPTLSPRFYVPSKGPDDWQKLLASPDLHWKTGHSAKCLAHAWESAQGFPPEVVRLFATSDDEPLRQLELILALPEHKVVIPPSNRSQPQSDLFVLAKASDGSLISITVEGKVNESFDEALAQWYRPAARDRVKRLKFIQEQLSLGGDLPATIRYQLLQRTVSAVVEATRFGAKYAAMVVHSFSQAHKWFPEYKAFLALFGVAEPKPGQLYFLNETQGVGLYSGWAEGDKKYLVV
jgi:hypothetical protein